MDERERAGLLANQARWDESVPWHAESDLYDLAGFRAGRDDIRPFEHEEIGDVQGQELLHLQCHLGTDTLSWARHGARVAGLDFSPNAIEVATALAADCAIDARFWCADVYDAADAVDGRRFDIVSTGIGALGWLPDLSTWAREVASLLRPGGVLYLVEIHPIVIGLLGDGLTMTNDILDAAYIEWDEKGGTYAAPDAIFENSTTTWDVDDLGRQERAADWGAPELVLGKRAANSLVDVACEERPGPQIDAAPSGKVFVLAEDSFGLEARASRHGET